MSHNTSSGDPSDRAPHDLTLPSQSDADAPPEAASEPTPEAPAPTTTDEAPADVAATEFPGDESPGDEPPRDESPREEVPSDAVGATPEIVVDAAGLDVTPMDVTPFEVTPTDATPLEISAVPEEPAAPETPPAPPLPQSFDELELPDALRRAIARVGWSKPTPVQALSFTPLNQGRDVLVQSHTGSGKTGAFCIPWLASRFDPRPAPQTGVQLLVLLPTRELAKQVSDELGRLAVESPVEVLPIYGGTAMQPQLSALKAGVHAVVGTPGRILDHIRRRSLDLSKVTTVVLDECDEMLSMGFLEDIRAILDACTGKHQTALFSATIPSDIQRISKRYMHDPVDIQLSGDQVAAAEIEHAYYIVGGAIKTRDLLDVIATEEPRRAIVFCNTREETKLVANVLRREGYQAEELSSDLTQAQREKVMGMMREHKLRFLVATDVAARGIDISHVSHVINYSFPESAEVYIHRTGRTGRAGRTGTAISLIHAREIGNFYYLKLQYETIQFKERFLPPPEQLAAQRQEVKLDAISKRFPELVSPEWVLLARNLMADPRGERVIGLLLERAMKAPPKPEPTVEEGEGRPADAAPAEAGAEAPRALETREEPREERREYRDRDDRRGFDRDRPRRDGRDGRREGRFDRDRRDRPSRFDRDRRDDRGDRRDRPGRFEGGEGREPREGTEVREARPEGRFEGRPEGRPEGRFEGRPEGRFEGREGRSEGRFEGREGRPEGREGRPEGREGREGREPREGREGRERRFEGREGREGRRFEGREGRERRFEGREGRPDRRPRPTDAPETAAAEPTAAPEAVAVLPAPVPGLVVNSGEATAGAPVETGPTEGRWIPIDRRGRRGDRGRFVQWAQPEPGASAAVGATDVAATGEPAPVPTDLVEAPGEPADEVDAGGPATLESADARRKRRRKRRKRRGLEGGAEATAPDATAGADTGVESDDEGDDEPEAAEVETGAPSLTGDLAGEGRRKRRRRRRGRHEGRPVAEAAPPPVPEVIPVPPPKRVSQDEIVIDIDEAELEVVTSEFGDLDDIDEFALTDRRQAVIETLQEEIELEDVSRRDALTTPSGEVEAEADEEDDGEAEAETNGEAATEAEAEANGEAEEPGTADDKKRKRRRRRKKSAPPAPPELTAPPHKDFWEVWSSKFTYKDFEDDKVGPPPELPEPPPAPVVAERPTPAPVSERQVVERTVERPTPAPRPSRPPPPPPAVAAAADADDGEFIKVQLNLGRAQGHKSATIRYLLREHLGLEGRSIRDLTVRDVSTLFRIHNADLERCQGVLTSVVVDGIGLTLERADAELRAPLPEDFDESARAGAALASLPLDLASEPPEAPAAPVADEPGT